MDEFFFARARWASTFPRLRSELGGLLFELSTSWAAARLGIVHYQNKLPANADQPRATPGA